MPGDVLFVGDGVDRAVVVDDVVGEPFPAPKVVVEGDLKRSLPFPSGLTGRAAARRVHAEAVHGKGSGLLSSKGTGGDGERTENRRAELGLAEPPGFEFGLARRRRVELRVVEVGASGLPSHLLALGLRVVLHHDNVAATTEPTATPARASQLGINLEWHGFDTAFRAHIQTSDVVCHTDP